MYHARGRANISYFLLVVNRLVLKGGPPCRTAFAVLQSLPSLRGRLTLSLFVTIKQKIVGRPTISSA